MNLKSNEFDAIVIGGGLSGLVVASGLSSSMKVALVDKGELPGGLCRSTTGYKNLTGHFHTLPLNEEAQKSIDFLELLLARPINSQKVTQHPLTFDHGFKPFVGFGDNAPECADELGYYLAPNRLYLHETPQDWIHLLFEKFRGEFFNLSEVTKILIEENKCSGVIINGQKQLLAKKVIFCGNPKELLTIIAAESLPTRVRQKISKSTLWTSVLIQLVHNRVICEDSSLHFLGQKTETDGFCLGQFFSPVQIDSQTTIQSSQWLTFVSEFESDEEEVLGQTVRRLKKLIQKAFPNSFDDLRHEKITINPQSHGRIQVNLNETNSIEGLEGLYLVSPFVSSELKNIAGSLQQAEACLRGLGFCAAP